MKSEEKEKVQTTSKTKTSTKEPTKVVNAEPKRKLEELLGESLYNVLKKRLDEGKIKTVEDFYIAMAYQTVDLKLTSFAIEKFTKELWKPIKNQLELTEEEQEALLERSKRKLPEFVRQDAHKYKRLGMKWRRPRGIHSKLRRSFGYRPPLVKIGYGTNKLVRGLHPTGYEMKYVWNVRDCEGTNPKRQALVIGRTVGTKKRMTIEKHALENKFYVINKSQIGLTNARYKELNASKTQQPKEESK